MTIPERLSPFKVLLENDVLTNAAIVLFGKDPYKYYLHCKVRLARFEGVIMDKFRDQSVVAHLKDGGVVFLTSSPFAMRQECLSPNTTLFRISFA